ncbi:MAG: hypothetical protein LBC80_01540 [Treponema sp.]|jgi:hypothetical protein|nr:hypothetical protein [Treponema sp.]
MRTIFLLLIIFIVIVFYGIIPVAGLFFSRHKWSQFRKTFNTFRLCRLLDYRQYRQLDKEGGVFRFTGEIESITDGHTLWVKGEDMTIPVSLEKTKCFLLPIQESDETEIPEQIRWNKVCTLTEGAKVFIGGLVKMQNNRLYFCSTKEEPLMVIIYNCPDSQMPAKLISCARPRNDYWNSITPVSLTIGALILIYIASAFLGRPAFHLIVISAIIAVFIPILPVLPPGILFTILSRRLNWNIRRQKAEQTLAHFGILPDANNAGFNLKKSRYAIKTIVAEISSCLALLVGIIINVIFIFIMLFQFEIITF